jgi:hypothetical protein
MISARSNRLLGWAFFGAAMMTAGDTDAAGKNQQVDLKLVIATDVSRSIDEEEGQLQREGTAEAFLNSEVVRAIQGGSLGRIAVAMLDFSSPEYDKVVIDWHIVHDRASAAALADLIRKTPRTPGRRTSISSALELGAQLIEQSPEIVATRNVIDVSGDGPNNDGRPMTDVHNEIMAKGIIVNGLPVMDDADPNDPHSFFPGLDKYYASCVVGGKGAFVVTVHAFKDFGTAMRRKLILEISDNGSPIKAAQNGLLIRAATGGQPSTGHEPEFMRPTPSNGEGCDIAGGFGFGGF